MKESYERQKDLTRRFLRKSMKKKVIKAHHFCIIVLLYCWKFLMGNYLSIGGSPAPLDTSDDRFALIRSRNSIFAARLDNKEAIFTNLFHSYQFNL